jgi:hypothetical protein
MAMQNRVDDLVDEVSWLRSRLNEAYGDSYGDVAVKESDACCGPMWQCGFYGAISGGFQNRDIGKDIELGTAAEWSTGFGVSGLVGYRTRWNIRPEFEFSMLDNDNERFYLDFANGVAELSNGHVTLNSFMCNVYYDMPLEHWMPSLYRLRPYFGIGIGTTESQIKGVTSETLQAGIPGVFDPTVLDETSRYNYSWQTRVGFTYLLCENSEFYTGWRHFETRTLEFKTEQFPDVIVTGANVDMWEMGIRIFF